MTTLKPPTRSFPKLVMKEWPKLDPETCIANLRHAYSQLSAGTVVDQCSFAQGLLGPAIEGLEDFTRVVEGVQGKSQNDRLPSNEGSCTKSGDT